jgi:hypothetical protein
MTTYGEYVKTKEAQKEANEQIREHIKLYTNGGERKVIKMKMGKPGTLNYGRAVVMFRGKIDPRILKIKPKYQPTITVLSMNYGFLERMHSKGRNFDQYLYRSKVAAEKRFASEVRMMSYGV